MIKIVSDEKYLLAHLFWVETVKGVLFGVGKPYCVCLIDGEYSILGDKIFKKFNGSSSQLCNLLSTDLNSDQTLFSPGVNLV